ncbi:hypothetical protein F5B20DRAFT_593955 [Whalleya microplaca]|nr:hypothetical protein F5B20DRAFT_593955 [Whalleya microplaca]
MAQTPASLARHPPLDLSSRLQGMTPLVTAWAVAEAEATRRPTPNILLPDLSITSLNTHRPNIARNPANRVTDQTENNTILLGRGGFQIHSNNRASTANVINMWASQAAPNRGAAHVLTVQEVPDYRSEGTALSRKRALDFIPPQRRPILGEKRRKVDEKPVCANCGAEDHLLGRCAVPHRHHGDINGCPECNTKMHVFDNCHKLPTMSLERKLELLIYNRQNLPQIRVDSINIGEAFYICDARIRASLVATVRSFPWTREHALQQWEEDGGKPWERADYSKSIPDMARDMPNDPRIATDDGIRQGAWTFAKWRGYSVPPVKDVVMRDAPQGETSGQTGPKGSTPPETKVEAQIAYRPATNPAAERILNKGDSKFKNMSPQSFDEDPPKL